MRVKVPQTLVTFPREGEIIVYNYLTKTAISCAPSDIYWLTVAPDWTSIEDISASHPHIEAQSLQDQITRLVDLGILLGEDTPEAESESSYRQSWELGMAAGLFHFSVQDNEYAAPQVGVSKQLQRAEFDPSPELFWRNSDKAIPLPECASPASKPLLEIMRRRRTNRNVERSALSLQELSECLYAGLGITGLVRTETGLLPLKMTPSGGARNPFEAFVLVRNVQSLDAGIYHYSAFDHSLEQVADPPGISPKELVKGQEWADDMPAIIFLVAVLRRTTWKYNDPNAYRVVLIEAGHIAQNIMLACTSNNLTACPTAALSHKQISKVLNLSDITQTPIYALLVGRPGENTDTIVAVERQPRLAGSTH
jgi:SagB-type dehydrogenase family enzyme